MAHEFSSEVVEEFYNSCHTTTDGRFCGRGAKGKRVIRVPFSEAARRSNATLRRLASDRKSKEYKNTRRRLAEPKKQPNKDGSEALKGRFRTSGDRKADMIKITQLDRGSAERKAAVRAYEKAYGGK